MKNVYVLPLLFLFSVQNSFAQVWPATLGAGMNNDVNALAVDNVNNILYAGGLFTEAGGQPASKIARWTGSSWQPMGTGVVGNVYAMLFHAGKLYVGGSFTSIDGVAATNVAYYDGMWHAMDTGLSGTLSEVRAFVIYNNQLVAGGKFSYASGWQNIGNVARWNGSVWMTLDYGLNDKVWALDVYNNELYAAGQFDSTGTGIFCRAVAKYNTSGWLSLGEGPQILVRALKVYKNELYAGGNFACAGNGVQTEYLTGSRLARWNGSRWTNIGPAAWNGGSPVNCTGASDLVSALCSFNGELWLGGSFTSVSNTGPVSSCAYRIARCNGNSFSPVGSGCAGVGGAISFPTVNAIAEYNGNLVLGGRFALAGGIAAGHITLLNPPPVNEVRVEHDLEFHHLGMEDPKELFNGRTDLLPAKGLKICADGSKSTIFKFIVKDIVSEANVRFRVKGDTLNGDPDAFGEFDASDYSISGDTVKARFTHPHFISTAAALFVSDSIQVVDISNNHVLYTIGVKFYRAPVTLVHGIWSNGDFWKAFNQQLLLNGYVPELTFRMDYSATHAVHFAQNQDVVPEAIRRTIRQARDADYSCGTADLMVHSMGGILSRLYLQGTGYNNDLHKLITANSPHAGAQSCNLLRSPVWGPVLSGLFYYFDMNCDAGAVDDFQVDDAPITADLNGVFLNYRNVPSHTLTTHTTITQSATGISDWAMLFVEAGAIATGHPLDFTDVLFTGDAHDLIVAEPSQTAGCSKTTTQNPYWHSAWSAGSNAAMFTPVIQLIKESAIDTNYFSIDGFHPPLLTSVYMPVGGNNDFSRSSGDVMFTNLPSIDTITSNMQATFDVAATGDIQRMLIVIAGSPDAMMMVDTAAPSASVTFVIDNRIFGRAKAMVIGYDSTGIIDVDTVEIVVNDYPGYQCSSLAAYPETSFLIPGTTGAILTSALCAGGERYVTPSPHCTYQVLNSSVADHTSANQFRALQPGETKVVVSYNGLTDTVRIIVDDTIVDQIATSIEDMGEQQENWEGNAGNTNVESLIHIFPNPATEKLFITAEETILTEVIIYNINGSVINRYATSQTNSIDISLLKTGVYIAEVKTKEVSVRKRWVKM